MVAMDGHVSKEYVLQLIRKKDDIEAAIKTYQDVLKSVRLL